MMKKIYLLSLLFVCFTTKSFSYDGLLNPSCCSNFCGSFEISAEWLFMQGLIDQPFFAVEQIGDVSSTPNGKRFANEKDWHSGYRLDAAYYIPCGCSQDYIRARWTHFPEFRNRRQVSGDLEAILNHPANLITGIGTASIQDQFRVYDLELFWGRPIFCNCFLKLALEVGLQWIKIDFDEEVNYFLGGNSALIRNESEFNGVGPDIALNLSYVFCQCFSFKGRAATSFLISRRKVRFFESFNNGAVIYVADNDPYVYGTPNFNFRAGLNYFNSLNFCGCRQPLSFNLEVGYEFIHFLMSVDRIYFVDSSNTGSSLVQHQNFTLHGPYIHLGFCF